MVPDRRTHGQRTSTQATPPDTTEWKQLQDEADTMVSSVPLGACPRTASKGYKQGRGRLGGTEVSLSNYNSTRNTTREHWTESPEKAGATGSRQEGLLANLPGQGHCCAHLSCLLDELISALNHKCPSQ